MGRKPDYYEILGVPRAATAAEIRRAFRRLARELHPDINPSPDATRRFQALNQAYRILKNSVTRAAYDGGTHRPSSPPSQSTPPRPTYTASDQTGGGHTYARGYQSARRKAPSYFHAATVLGIPIIYASENNTRDVAVSAMIVFDLISMFTALFGSEFWARTTIIYSSTLIATLLLSGSSNKAQVFAPRQRHNFYWASALLIVLAWLLALFYNSASFTAEVQRSFILISLVYLYPPLTIVIVALAEGV